MSLFQIQSNIITQDFRISRFAFRNRFTIQELTQIELASIDDPNGTQEQRAMQAMLRVYNRMIDNVAWVDLSLQSTIDGVTQLEQIGLLAEGRANEILSAPITLSERP